MFQESADRINGNSKTDTLAFIVLIAFFFIAGIIATVLRTMFQSSIPLYVFAAVFAGLLYLFYRLRIVGWRYTVFYKEPEPEYDPRFDDYITHEDYPYPVGTVVLEKTVSAKGEIISVIDKNNFKAFLEPGAEYVSDSELICGPRKKAESCSIVYLNDTITVRVFFSPSDEFKAHIKDLFIDK